MNYMEMMEKGIPVTMQSCQACGIKKHPLSFRSAKAKVCLLCLANAEDDGIQLNFGSECNMEGVDCVFYSYEAYPDDSTNCINCGTAKPELNSDGEVITPDNSQDSGTYANKEDELVTTLDKDPFEGYGGSNDN